MATPSINTSSAAPPTEEASGFYAVPTKKLFLEIADDWMLRGEAELFVQGITTDTYAIDPAGSVGIGGGPQIMRQFGDWKKWSEFRIGPYFECQSQTISQNRLSSLLQELPDEDDALSGYYYHQFDHVTTYTRFSPLSLGIRASTDFYTGSNPDLGKIFLGPSLTLMGHNIDQLNRTSHVYQTFHSNVDSGERETNGGYTTESTLGLTAKAALNLRVGHVFGYIGGGILVNPLIQPLDESSTDSAGFIVAGMGTSL
jgi:hypothetical protein